MRRHRALVLLLPLVALSGCGALSRLSDVGRPPSMDPTTDPTRTPTWRPVSMPMPAPEPPPAAGDSLWRQGSRAFFKDRRASRVGDLVTVLVNMADTALLNNNTTATRTGADNMGVANLFGLENVMQHVFVKPINPAKLVTTNSTNSNVATGQIQRNETVTVRLAGVVTQVLPNGNLVVLAHQQFRVDNELRDLQVSGVIRPEDIASDNTVQHDRMAEARIAYGGKGQLTDLQGARWGQQVMDILLPF